jgi:hypothetical protein
LRDKFTGTDICENLQGKTKAIFGITSMRFSYTLMGALIMYTLRETYYHSIPALPISMRYWGLLF